MQIFQTFTLFMKQDLKVLSINITIHLIRKSARIGKLLNSQWRRQASQNWETKNLNFITDNSSVSCLPWSDKLTLSIFKRMSENTQV